MERGLSYDDVLLSPQYSDITSRQEIDISSDLGQNAYLLLPIIASPMDTISDSRMAGAMDAHRATAIIHRYMSIEEQCRHLDALPSEAVVGGAVGVTGDFEERATDLALSGVSIICVDVAHGHHILMKNALKVLRNRLDDNIHIMAGNVATLEGINDLADWGAHSARCNIGGGSICSTRIQTGHGIPGLQTIINCAKTDRDIKIIADGGIRNAGDMVKALAAGADAVMCGSLLSGTEETPGKILQDIDGTRWKSYRGMASKEAQVDWHGHYSSFEGVAARVPYRGPVKHILEELERGIRSGFSYTGARNLKELQARARFVHQTPSGLSESHTHILNRQWT